MELGIDASPLFYSEVENMHELEVDLGEFIKKKQAQIAVPNVP